MKIPSIEESFVEKKAWESRFRIFFQLSLLAILISLAGARITFADIYKWQDESGQWHFSDQPPPESQNENWWDEKGDVIQTGSPPAQAPLEGPETEDLEKEKPVGNGVLWKIEGGGISASYILGTIHSEDPRVLRFSPELESALRRKDVFIMEVVLDDSALARISASMILMEGRTLDAIIGEDLYAKTVRAASNRGIPEIALKRMKPWAVVSVLSTPKSQTGQFMDVKLYGMAREQNKQVVGLETVEEQILLFDSMPTADQVALLKETLNHEEKLSEMFEKLIETYISGDLKKVAELGKSFMAAENPELTERILKRFNEDRNYRMVDRMLPYLVAGDAFVAVGAMHLPGKNGIIDLLKMKGFKVSKVL